MPKLPHLSGNQVVKALSNAGFLPVRQKGSHLILIQDLRGKKKAVVVPLHKEIDTGTLLEILRQAGLKRDDFLDLLHYSKTEKFHKQ